MPYSVRSLIEQNGYTLKDSIYADSDPRMLDFQIYSKDFYEVVSRDSKAVLRFKNTADILDFELLKKQLPELDGIRMENSEWFPFAADRLEIIADALAEDRNCVAVEGGPCLFSEKELIAEVTDRTGRVTLFDFAGGEAYSMEGSAEDQAEENESIAMYVQNHLGEISDIRFRCFKKGLSPQEYLHLRLPFEAAAALNVRLVVSLPDMSYRKYLAVALEKADPDFREKVLQEYDLILNSIADSFLDVIRKLQELFRIKDLTVFHGRDPELLERFYQAREPYIGKNKVLKNLTGKPERFEALKDYVSMPALPYYLFGSTRILEVNSVVELDSFRKCLRAHRRDIDMACLLFPELLSADGIHTMYYAPIEYKEYGKFPLDK